MTGDDREWMAYIDAEVRAVCDARGWGRQVRRKWAVREHPVWDSPIEEYEWKLIPSAHGRLPDAPSDDYDGTYYVLWFDRPRGRFVLQHDTQHVGILGPHWERETYTEIHPTAWQGEIMPRAIRTAGAPPPVGWLRDHIDHLVARYAPNSFSVT